jgi:hypothetical protein
VGKNYKGICIDSLVSVNTLGISAMQLIGINKILFKFCRAACSITLMLLNEASFSVH